MDEFLAPSGIIDWRPLDTNLTRDPWRHPAWWEMFKPDQLQLHEVQDRIISIETNEPINKDYPGYVHVELFSNTTHCLFHALFQAAPKVLEASMQQYQKLGLDPMQAYTAVHFRLGGSVGEAELWPLTNALTSLLRSIKCARQLGQKHNLTGDQAAHKLLLLTDHARLRTFLAEGFFTDVVSSPIVPYHFDMANEGLTGLYTTMADVVLMAHASCLTMQQSGFGRIARWWSLTPCFAENNEGCQDTRRTLAADPMVAPGSWSSRQTGPAHGMPLAVGLRKIHAWLHESEPHGESTSTHNLTVVEREAVSSYIRDVLAQ
ncbi:hypothetical protein V8C86DRAFT_2574118 [Haematococcus lacustris]